MPVDHQHKQYKQHAAQWRRCRDAATGSDAVKGAGQIYLPQLSQQTMTEYDAYRARALFYGATKRTLQALLGAVFRKDPTFAVPNAMEARLEDLSSLGEELDTFAQRVVREVLKVGRLGMLVDVAQDNAYVALYQAEDIINWDVAFVDGVPQLTRVVLHEMYSNPDAGDEFTREETPQYRVLELVNGLYQQRLFRRAEGQQEWAPVPKDEAGNIYPLAPLRNGARLDFIPMVIVNPTSLTTQCEEPPLLELVDVNLSHYRTSADLEHGAHFTALPTPWVAGFPKDTVLYMGSTRAWVSDNPQANAGFLEYTGQGLSALSTLLEGKEQKMAALGARLLDTPKRAPETAETHRLRLSGEGGALASVVKMASSGLARALRWVAWWEGMDDTSIEVELNQDFYDVRMAPQELTALIQARQAGEISYETFIYNLERGEMLPPDTDADTERARLDAEGPSLGGMPLVGGPA